MSVSTPLLTTKLYLPSARPTIVPRPRLTARISEGLTRPFTLISAPAGFGKTTLLSEWRTTKNGCGFPLAWLSLDNDDNDPTRFLTYLIAALQTLKPSLGENALALLQSSQPSPPQAILTSLINDLSEIEEPFALVLDDYHFIAAHPIHESLIFLLDHQPPLIHLVILTRADPPLPLARLRARNQVTEIRAADLRFTHEEATTFFNRVMALTLSAENVTALERRTEGWIAGLQLAALSMEGREDLPQFITTFGGSHHYIVDYLAEEVLNHQPDSVKSFLLQTSILDRLTASLCTTLTGRHDSQQLLEELERANLFIIALDEDRRWYRYHHLFADALRSQLRHWIPEQVAELQRQASAWHAQQGLYEEAVMYALAANDFVSAARLIGENGWGMLMQGRVSSLLEWIAALPTEVTDTRINLAVLQAWGLFVYGKEDEMVRSVQQIEANTSANCCGEVTLLHAIGARWRGEMDSSLAFSQQALENLPHNNLFLRGQAWFNLGMLYREHDITQAHEAFAQASLLGETSHDFLGALRASFFQGAMLRLQGSLRRSDTVCEHALQLAEKQSYSNVAGFSHLGISELFYERNELEAAAAHLQQAREIAEQRVMRELHFDVALAMARLYCARHAWAEAQNMIRQAQQLAWQAKNSCPLRIHTFIMIPIAQEQVHLWLAQGKGREATAWLQDTDLSSDGAPLVFRLCKQTILARQLLVQNQPIKALSLLDDVLQEAQQAHVLDLRIQLLQALALYTSNEAAQALTVLSRALELAEPEGYIRTFLDEGAPMAELLRHAGSRGIAPKYVAQLLSEFEKESGAAAATPHQPLIEPLSDREIEVLRLLAAGKSNQEIADDLVLALGTVKKHLNNIFGKLSVQSRTECAARARELRLL